MRRTLSIMVGIVAVLVVFGAGADQATAGLVDLVLLHMDEGSGSTTEDDTYYQNNGELGGHGSGTPAWTSGKFGGALQFNPSGGDTNAARTVVWCPSDPSLNVTKAMTLEAWIWRNDDVNPTGYNPIAIRGCYGLTGFWFFTKKNTGELQCLLYGESGSTAPFSSASVPAGEWHHVAMTYQSGVGGSLYIDGNPDGTLDNVGDIKWVSATKDTTTWPLTLGSDPNPGGYAGYHVMDGRIDEFAMYSYALTPDEVYARAHGGPPKSVPEPSSLLLLALGLMGLGLRRWRKPGRQF